MERNEAEIAQWNPVIENSVGKYRARLAAHGAVRNKSQRRLRGMPAAADHRQRTNLAGVQYRCTRHDGRLAWTGDHPRGHRRGAQF